MGELLEEIHSYWDGRAEGYSKVNQEELNGEQKEKWLQVLRERFPNRRPEEVRVLDVGTGPGFFAVILAENHYQVTAVDYTEAMLEQARKNAGELAEQICWHRMDAQQLEFDPEQFDVVISRNLTWNLENPGQAYREWFRVLKPGGTLLNFDANWYAHLVDDDLRKAYEADRKWVESMKLEDHYACTDTEWMEAIARKMPLTPVHRPEWDCRILEKIGFSVVKSEKNIGERVWSLTEKINYQSTPMFCVTAWK